MRRKLATSMLWAGLLHGLLLLALAVAPLVPAFNETQDRARRQAEHTSPLWIDLSKDTSQTPDSTQAPEKPSATSGKNQIVQRETRALPGSATGGLARFGVNLARPQAQDEIRDILRQQEDSPSTQSPSGPLASLDDPNLPVGAETLLNTQQTVYYSFYSRLFQSIAPVWQSRIHSTYLRSYRRVLPGRYTTRVAVWLDRHGNLKSLQVLDPSQIPLFNQAVIDSWKRIERFPNPPQGMMDREGNVRTLWSFTVEVGEGAGWTFLPPKRI